jgi:hypothetical protein
MYAPTDARQAYREGTSITGALAKNARKSLSASYHFGLKGQALFMLPMAALAVGSAPRGHKIAAAGTTIGEAIGTAAGALIGGLPGAIVGGMLGNQMPGGEITSGIQWFHDLARDHRRINLGQGYQDTQVAYTMRQAAVRELSGSLMNARQYLGQEGVLSHS